MSQKRTTTYACDHCGNEVARKRDLRRLTVHDSPRKVTLYFDVCQPCEGLFVDLVAAWLPEEENAEGLRRG